MKTTEYLDKCKIALKVQSHYALAKALKINSGIITHYYQEKRIPDAYACAKIALALKLDPLEVLADIESQTAKTEEKREFWRGFIGRTGKAAAGLLLALSCWIFYTSAPTGAVGAVAAVAASAACLWSTRKLRIMYIMLNIGSRSYHAVCISIQVINKS